MATEASCNRLTTCENGNEQDEIFALWKRQFPSFREVKIERTAPALELSYGIFSEKNFSEGSLVYSDVPLVAMQHIYSKRCCQACQHCFRICGDFASQVNGVLHNESTSLESRFPELLVELQRNEKLSEALDSSMPKAVNCPFSCNEVYCSEACMNEAIAKTEHQVVCESINSRAFQSWRFFERHAKKFNENFILAGKTIMYLIDIIHDKGIGIPQAMREFVVFSRKRWEDLTPGISIVKTSVSDVLLRKSSRLHILETSLKLLQECLLETPKLQRICLAQEIAASEIFSSEFYSNLLGTFELVNVSVEFEHPLNPVIIRLASAWPEAYSLLQPIFNEIRRISLCLPEDTPFSLSEESAGEVFSPFIGIALYRSVALTNHSCWPNVEVDYECSSEVTVYALRQISKGEEIYQSYIDESLPLAERQKNLKEDFKFICRCLRCRIEAGILCLKRRRKNQEKAETEQLCASSDDLEEISILTGLPKRVIGDFLLRSPHSKG